MIEALDGHALGETLFSPVPVCFKLVPALCHACSFLCCLPPSCRVSLGAGPALPRDPHSVLRAVWKAEVWRGGVMEAGSSHQRTTPVVTCSPPQEWLLGTGDALPPLPAQVLGFACSFWGLQKREGLLHSSHRHRGAGFTTTE